MQFITTDSRVHQRDGGQKTWAGTWNWFSPHISFPIFSLARNVKRNTESGAQKNSNFSHTFPIFWKKQMTIG